MHAPLGDDYFNVMQSMLEREREFTPVTASIVDRHVLAQGSQEKVINNISRKDKEENPDLVIVTPTCTSSILQEDRKSTRLNSSHLVISYAVFCLKKKKKTSPYYDMHRPQGNNHISHS